MAYSQQEIKFVASHRKKGWQWVDVAAVFNEHFKQNKTDKQLRDASSKGGWVSAEIKDTREGQGDISRTYGDSKKTYFITSAYPLNTNLPATSNAAKAFLKSVETFKLAKKAIPQILLMRAHNKALQDQAPVYDKTIQSYRSWWATQVQFGKYIKAIDLHLNPQQANPLTGLKTLGSGSGYLFKDVDTSGDLGVDIRSKRMMSVIVAAPSQQLETIPTSFSSHPRLIASTGSCCEPQYLPNRVGVLADHRHTIGGLVLEVKGSRFWLRQVQADTDGSFVDMGFRYHPDGSVTEERALFLSPGDLHLGTHRERSLQTLLRMNRYFQPQNQFINDVATIVSASFFLDSYAAANLPPHLKSLPNEFAYVRKRLAELRASAGDANMFVNWSNHHKRLHTYIQKGDYIKNPLNRNVCVQLEALMQLGFDPFEVAMECGPSDYMNIPTTGLTSTMRYFEPGEDYYLDGIHMSNHGHAGVNSKRGTIQSSVLAFGKSILNHFHMAGIYGGVYLNGALEHRPDYIQDQPETWVTAHTVGYSGGLRQLIFDVGGRFHVGDEG